MITRSGLVFSHHSVKTKLDELEEEIEELLGRSGEESTTLQHGRVDL